MNLSYWIHDSDSIFLTKLCISFIAALYAKSTCRNSSVFRLNFWYVSTAFFSSGISSANCFAIT